MPEQHKARLTDPEDGIKWLKQGSGQPLPAQNGLEGLKLRGNSWETLGHRQLKHWCSDHRGVRVRVLKLGYLHGRRDLRTKSKRREHLVTGQREKNEQSEHGGLDLRGQKLNFKCNLVFSYLNYNQGLYLS